MGSAIKLVSGVVKSVVNVVKNVVNAVVDTVKKVINTVVDTVKKVVDQVVKVVKNVVEFVSDFVVNLVNNIITFIRTGDIAAIVMTIAAAIMTGGTSLIVQFGVPALTQTMVQHGMISESWAMAINIGVQIYMMWQGFSAAQDNIANMKSFFTSMGVSIETATWLANSINTAMSILGPLMTLKSVYDAYKDSKAIKDAYETMLAEFEAWKATLGGWNSYSSRLEASDREIQSYADNSYYKKLPGQPAYAAYSAGHSNFVATDSATPAHWIEDTKSPYREDPAIAKLLWSNKFSNPMAEFDLVPYNFENGTTYNTYVSAGYDLSTGSGISDVVSTAIRNNKLEVQRIAFAEMTVENKQKALEYMNAYFQTQTTDYYLNNYMEYIQQQRADLASKFRTEVVDKLITKNTVSDNKSTTTYVPVQNITKLDVMAGTAVNAGSDYQYDELLKWYYGAENTAMFGEKDIANKYFSSSLTTGIYTLSGHGDTKYRKFNEIDPEAWKALIDASKQFQEVDNQLVQNYNELAAQRTEVQNTLKTYFSRNGGTVQNQDGTTKQVAGLEDVLSYLTVGEVNNLYNIGGYGNIKGLANDLDMGFNVNNYNSRSAPLYYGDNNSYSNSNVVNINQYSWNQRYAKSNISGNGGSDYIQLQAGIASGKYDTSINTGVDWSLFSGSASNFGSLMSISGSTGNIYNY